MNDEGKNYRKELEEFIAYWEKEVEDIKNRAIAEEDCYKILQSLIHARSTIILGMPNDPDIFTWSDARKLLLLESKLVNSLAKALSNYRIRHKTLLERFIDSIGKIRLSI